MKILEINNLNYKNILTNISLSMNKGEILFFIGESGSGKTTLAKCIFGINTDYSGKITINGLDIKNTDIKKLSFIRSFVPQNSKLCIDPKYTVKKTISEAFDIHNIKYSEKDLIKLLNDVSLNEKYLNRNVNSLSGGERQRVLIARSLCLNPKILICDEPSSSLDTDTENELLELFKNLVEKKGLSLIWISHNITLAKKLANKIVVIYKGQIVDENHHYTKKLLNIF